MNRLPYSGSEELYDAIYQFKNYRSEVLSILDIAEKNGVKARSILDIACGTHEHGRFLPEEVEVFAIDVNQRFIDIAKRKNPTFTYQVSDMRGFSLGRSFNVIMCLSSSIGYLSGYDELESALAAMESHLEPGGFIAVEPWYSPETWRGDEIFTTVGKTKEFHVSRIGVRSRQNNKSKIMFHYLVAGASGATSFHEEHCLSLFTEREIRAAFSQVGITVEHDGTWSQGRGLYFGVKSSE